MFFLFVMMDMLARGDAESQ